MVTSIHLHKQKPHQYITLTTDWEKDIIHVTDKMNEADRKYPPFSNSSKT